VALVHTLACFYDQRSVYFEQLAIPKFQKLVSRTKHLFLSQPHILHQKMTNSMLVLVGVVSATILVNAQIPIVIGAGGCSTRPSSGNLWINFPNVGAYYEFTSYWWCFYKGSVPYSTCINLDATFNVSFVSLTSSSHDNCNGGWQESAPNQLHAKCSCNSGECSHLYAYIYLQRTHWWIL
jgi:hypothetical protein